MAIQSVFVGPSADTSANPAGAVSRLAGPNLWLAYYELQPADSLLVWWFGRGRSRGLTDTQFRSPAIIEQVRINRADVTDTVDVSLYPLDAGASFATPIAQITGATPTGAVVASGQNLLSNDPENTATPTDALFIGGGPTGVTYVWILLREDV